MAQEISQRPGLDYTNAYSPMASATGIRKILAITASSGMEIATMDVDSTYLY